MKVQRFNSAACLGSLSVEINVWTATSSQSLLSRDDWLAESLDPDRVRIVAVDGATPWRSDHPAGLDAAVWAAGVTRTAARDLSCPADSLRAAHTTLWRPDIRPSRSRPSAAAAIADISNVNGRLNVSAAAAADCNVWVFADGCWAQLAGSDALEPDWRAAWEDEKRKNRNWSDEERLAAEAVFLDSPTCRLYPAVGRHQGLNLTSGSATDCEFVFATTDGSRINADALRSVSSFSGFDAFMESHVAGKSHGDVTVVAVKI